MTRDTQPNGRVQHVKSTSSLKSIGDMTLVGTSSKKDRVRMTSGNTSEQEA